MAAWQRYTMSLYQHWAFRHKTLMASNQRHSLCANHKTWSYWTTNCTSQLSGGDSQGDSRFDESSGLRLSMMNIMLHWCFQSI